MNDAACSTRYPILLVHGAGFRDLKSPVYWGRIPKALEMRGARLYYGEQDCWASTDDNARALLERIRTICDETSCGKMNIIAHSKGGLEARMAASSLGGNCLIASITTVATPHRGSKTIDRLLRFPHSAFNLAAFAVNNWIRLIGDCKPDFLRVINDFTTEHMQDFNAKNPDVSDVFYQSIACVMKHPWSDINLSTANLVVGRLEGPNDGLVSVESAAWGKRCRVITGAGWRGISHLDAIDLRRAPLSRSGTDGICDIIDLYIDIVMSLKSRGL